MSFSGWYWSESLYRTGRSYSIVIYIGHIIDPVDAEPFEVRHKSIEIGDLIWIDEDEHCYEADFNNLINPGLENDLYPSFWLFDNAQMGAFELPSDVSSLLTKREEFVTTPPITTLMLALASVEFDVCVDDEHWGHATLRVRTGIRVGDLLDMFSKIGGRTYQYWKPVAYFCLRGPGTITSLKEEYASEFAVDMGADNGKQLRDDEQIEKDPGEGCGDEADDNEHTVSHTSEQQDASWAGTEVLGFMIGLMKSNADSSGFDCPQLIPYNSIGHYCSEWVQSSAWMAVENGMTELTGRIISGWVSVHLHRGFSARYLGDVPQGLKSGVIYPAIST
jgi:hypothetical protein